MNKMISLSCMLFLLLCRLHAADQADEFLEIAQKATPEYYKLYFAAKFGPAEQQALLAIYAPTDNEPSMKKYNTYFDWELRHARRGYKLDPSDPEPEKCSYVSYDLFKVKMGFIDDLKDAPKVDVKPFRGSGMEILFRNKILYLPGGRMPCTPYSYIPLDSNDEGPILFSAYRGPDQELLFTKFTLNILYH